MHVFYSIYLDYLYDVNLQMPNPFHFQHKFHKPSCTWLSLQLLWAVMLLINYFTAEKLHFNAHNSCAHDKLIFLWKHKVTVDDHKGWRYPVENKFYQNQHFHDSKMWKLKTNWKRPRKAILFIYKMGLIDPIATLQKYFRHQIIKAYDPQPKEMQAVADLGTAFWGQSPPAPIW